MLCTMFLFAILTYLFVRLKRFFSVPPVPYVQEKWWGEGKPAEGAAKTEVVPFEVKVDDEILRDLRRRLDATLPFQTPIEGARHSYGMNAALLREIVDFWRGDGYEWREREKYLNRYPQFKTNVQGLDVHFLHVKPEETEGVRVRPILLLHGWPGSVREFYELIPLLTRPRDGYAFEVVAPSLPGFGFSEATSKPGLAPVHMAVILRNLMRRLGIRRYYVQGGDWGSLLVQDMALLYPDVLLGAHVNLASTSRTPRGVAKAFLARWAPWYFATDAEKAHLEIFDYERQAAEWNKESGYFHLQSTKPDTVGVALRDSPAGLAAYILEKFITWTNPAYRDRDDGGLKLRFDYTKLLDNVMIYWATGTATTAMRIYREYVVHELPLDLQRIPIRGVPCGVSRFWHEIHVASEAVMRERFVDLVHLADHDGGHFAALEVPEVLAGDVFAFVAAAERHRGSV